VTKRKKRRTGLLFLFYLWGPSYNSVGPGCNFLFSFGPFACCNSVIIN
jgi:hypothetical protein